MSPCFFTSQFDIHWFGIHSWLLLSYWPYFSSRLQTIPVAHMLQLTHPHVLQISKLSGDGLRSSLCYYLSVFGCHAKVYMSLMSFCRFLSYYTSVPEDWQFCHETLREYADATWFNLGPTLGLMFPLVRSFLTVQGISHFTMSMVFCIMLFTYLLICMSTTMYVLEFACFAMYFIP